MIQPHYATLQLEEDLSTDERLLQLFRDAHNKRESRQLGRFWLTVISAGVALLVIKVCRMQALR
jgi:hypothetical protein